MMGAHGIPLEVVNAVLDVADVAWLALERRPGGVPQPDDPPAAETGEESADVGLLREENRRLRAQLAENLELLRGVCRVPDGSGDCPPDLYERLNAAVDGSNFLTKLELLQRENLVTEGSTASNSSDVSVEVDGELSWWVWVTDKIPPESLEEASPIDEENYVIISEENVIDGIAFFIARCIIETPHSKTLSPQDLHIVVKRSLNGLNNRNSWRRIWEAGKVIYTLSTWGIVLAGFYRPRSAVKIAAKGISLSAKLVTKML